MSQPTGTVTFLFTDIQGSTKLWDKFPHTMGAALARHDEILSEAIRAAEGYVFKTIGDAFCAAFHTAPNALEAALQAQLALSRESWSEGIDIAVRMAVHSGSAEVRQSDYFGPPLNRVARLLSTGHGGQVLLSEVAQQLGRDALPSGSSLRSLGEFRLKDLGRPEHIYQLVHPELRDEFPKLRSLEDTPSNLPQQLTSFIGRESELKELSRLLESSRLVTLTGSGGCGKTRLALQLAADVLDAYEDGVWLVELAPISDPQTVARAVAVAVGAQEEKERLLSETLVEHLKDKRLLLILDNCEHLLEASARLAETLLRRCPGLRVLATSREQLGIGGEVNFRVPSLSAPPPNSSTSALSLGPFESVRLFIDRARNHLPGFEVTNQNAPALASVCHRLDGIPLAIELAAARVRSMSLDEINRRLDQRFSLLTGGARTHLPRQQTLRSLIDWSYDLLSEPEKQLLAGLSVFWGGWSMAGAEQVCSTDDVGPWDVVDLLLALVDKSLVVSEERGGTTRYRLLETVRQYASERLSAEDQVRICERHLVYFHDLAIERAPDFRSAAQQEWMSQLDLERENYRAALRWSLEMRRNLALGMEVAGNIWRYWYVRGFFAEGLAWLSYIEQPESDALAPEARATALNGAGVMAWSCGEYDRAQRLHEQSLALHRLLGDRRGIAVALNNLGLVQFSRGEYEAVNDLYGESAAIFRELGELYGVASLLNAQGTAAYYLGRLEEAQALLVESIALKRKIGDSHGLAMSLANLALMIREAGDLEGARALALEASHMYESGGDRVGTITTTELMGSLALDDGDFDRSKERFIEALEIGITDGMAIHISAALEGLAEVAFATKDYRRALRFAGCAARVRSDRGMVHSPPMRRTLEKWMAVARPDVNDEALLEAWRQEGYAMTAEECLRWAQEKL